MLSSFFTSRHLYVLPLKKKKKATLQLNMKPIRILASARFSDQPEQFHSIFKLPRGLVLWAPKTRTFSNLQCKVIESWGKNIKFSAISSLSSVSLPREATKPQPPIYMY